MNSARKTDEAPIGLRIAGVTSGLGAYLSTSEAVFLATGSQLDEVQERVQRLVRASESAGALAPRHGVEGPEEALGRAFGDIREHLGRSHGMLGTALQQLGKVRDGAGRIFGLRDPFNGLGLTLSTIAVGIRVESAAVARQGSFDNVAADVSRIGQTIIEKFESILAHVDGIRDASERAMVRARALAGRDQGRVEAAFQGSSQSLANLGRVAREARGLCDEADRTAEELGRGFQTVLVALQAHDRTRQVVEHVIEALDGAAHGDTHGTSAGPNEAAASSSAPGGVGVLCRLQASQLRLAADELQTALAHIGGELQRISGAAVRLSERAEGLGAPRTAAHLDAIEDGLQNMREALSEHQQREAETASSMARVVERIAASEAVIREIQNIGTGVKMIALNAQVAAGKAGHGGRTLVVLAREIREVSSDIDARTGLVASALQAVAAAGRSIATNDAERGAEQGQRMASEIDQLVHTLRSSRMELGTQLVQLAGDSAALRAQIAQLIDGLERARRTTSVLVDHAAELDAVAAATGQGDAAPGGTTHAKVRAASARYTMEHERKVHHEITGERVVGPAPRVSPTADPTLGANVELF